MGIKHFADLLKGCEEKRVPLRNVLRKTDGTPMRVGMDMGGPMFRLRHNSDPRRAELDAAKFVRSYSTLGYNTRELRKRVVLVYDNHFVFPPKLLKALERAYIGGMTDADLDRMGEISASTITVARCSIEHSRALAAAGFTVVFAAGEAEAEAVHLQDNGIVYNNERIEKVDIVLCDDSDSLALGVDLWARSISLYSQYNPQPCTCTVVDVSKHREVVRNLNVSFDNNQDFGSVWAIIGSFLSSDFSLGVPGYGRVLLLHQMSAFCRCDRDTKLRVNLHEPPQK